MAEDKTSVTDAEIQIVEKQVKETEAKDRVLMEEKVRKELATEQKARELETKLAEQQKMAEDAKQEAVKAKQEAESMIKSQVEQRLKEEVARSKQPINSINPFKGEASKPTFNQEDIPAINLASYEALREKFRK